MQGMEVKLVNEFQSLYGCSWTTSIHQYNISQVLLRGGSTYRDMLKGEEARREDLDIDIEVHWTGLMMNVK